MVYTMVYLQQQLLPSPPAIAAVRPWYGHTVAYSMYIPWYIPYDIYHGIYHMVYTMIYTMVYFIWYIPWYISSSNCCPLHQQLLL